MRDAPFGTKLRLAVGGRRLLGKTLMSAERYIFGEFELDSGTRVLTHKGRVVKLQAQPAQLLSILLARSGEVVSRDELKRAIWSEGTYVDFEKGLNFCIGQVRLALRDDASRPLYIRTIPKLGYQFIAPVESLHAMAGDPPPQTDAGNSRARWMMWTAACFGILVLVQPGDPPALPGRQ
jgi:DNA-binding winged helix-turn-helix (wHTH) protein